MKNSILFIIILLIYQNFIDNCFSQTSSFQKPELVVQCWANKSSSFIELSNNGELFAIANSSHNSVMIYDIKSRKIIRFIKELPSLPLTISFCPKDSLIAIGFVDRSCNIYNLNNGELLNEFNTQKRSYAQ